jgi:type VI secretion system FHA domain protein
MILTLEVSQPQAATLGDGGRKVFSAQGGTIGRAASCDWVLSHRKVSGRHATISYQDSIFYIVDEQSANGVFLNSTKNRLVPGRRYALKHGDRIIIDPYEMEVSISSSRPEESRRPYDNFSDARSRGAGAAYNPFDSPDPFAPPLRTPRPLGQPAPTPKPNPAGEVVPLDELDPLKLLEGTPKKTPVRPGPSAKDLENASPLAGHYQPPAVLTPPPATPPPAQPSSPVMIPADYDPLSDDFDESPPPSVSPPARPVPRPDMTSRQESPPDPRPTPAPVAPPTPAPPPGPPSPSVVNASEAPAVRPSTPAVRETPPPAGADPSDPGLVAVLAGAGLERAPVTLEFARSFGQIFRVVVSGVMDVLRARQQIKDEFRMRMTQFRAADNNPLKFSANVDDALHNLLVKRNAAYLEPVEAFEDAFDDLRDHQMAMLAGMRVAFEAMLEEFNPEALQKEFDRQLKRSALLGVTARMRYWDLYRERQEAMAKDPEATFRRLFGEQFAKAYEEQLKRLKAERRARSGTRPPDA